MTSSTTTARSGVVSASDSVAKSNIGVAAVNRALSILEAFTPPDGRLSLAELAQRTGLYKSTILRLIESLEAFGYLVKGNDGKYALGIAPLRLAAIYQKHVQTSELILPALRTLSEATTESASFYVIAESSRLCAYRVNSARSIRDHVQVGQLLPLDKGAAGVILQAFSGEEGARFDEVRKHGFAYSQGERDPETAAIAAPVFTAGDRLEGALCISGPATRFTDESVAAMKPKLLRLAAELTLALGGYVKFFCDKVQV